MFLTKYRECYIHNINDNTCQTSSLYTRCLFLCSCQPIFFLLPHPRLLSEEEEESIIEHRTQKDTITDDIFRGLIFAVSMVRIQSMNIYR